MSHSHRAGRPCHLYAPQHAHLPRDPLPHGIRKRRGASGQAHPVRAEVSACIPCVVWQLVCTSCGCAAEAVMCVIGPPFACRFERAVQQVLGRTLLRKNMLHRHSSTIRYGTSKFTIWSRAGSSVLCKECSAARATMLHGPCCTPALPANSLILLCRFERAVQQVLGRTLLCKNMDVALAAARSGELNCVTIEGDQVCFRSVFKNMCITVYRIYTYSRPSCTSDNAHAYLGCGAPHNIIA